jgi:hypothetical protein
MLIVSALCTAVGPGVTGCAWHGMGSAAGETWHRGGSGPERGGQRDDGARPDLSGTWVLNRDLSDDLRAKEREVRELAGPGAAGGATGFGRRGWGGGRAGEWGAGQEPGAGAASGRDRPGAWDLPTVFVLEQDQNSLTLITQAGERRRIYTDNRGSAVSASGGVQQEVVTAGWEDGTLVVETTTVTEERIVERYSLGSAPRQLSIDTSIQLPGRRRPVVLKRVYEPAAMDSRGHSPERP